MGQPSIDSTGMFESFPYLKQYFEMQFLNFLSETKINVSLSNKNKIEASAEELDTSLKPNPIRSNLAHSPKTSAQDFNLGPVQLEANIPDQKIDIMCSPRSLHSISS